VQTLPVGMIIPILSVLKALSRADAFGSTVLLCTATQPALRQRDGFPVGFEKSREIMGAPPEVQRLFDLVRYRWSKPSATDIPVLSWQQVAFQMIEVGRALAIVNTKRHARELFAALKQACLDTGCDVPMFHLSTAMCPAHRKAVLDQIKFLPQSARCLLVATQCVEAGVDLDFPVVFRALGPLDSLAQAAGRCNREGLGQGRLIVFQPEEHVLPPHAYRRGSEIATDMLRSQPELDLHVSEAFDRYFRALYNVSNLDEKQIQKLRANHLFKDVARQFKLIDQDTEPVIVRYGQAGHLLNALEEQGPSKQRFRELQPFTVSLYQKFANQQQALIESGPYGLRVWNHNYYDSNVGLVTQLDVDQTVV
jgi:CRISPR-associated endonuclease/helicase Cas3